MTRGAGALRAAGASLFALALAAHVGSPNVFFAGRAGPYDVKVVVRPPEVVPGVARVTVRTPPDVQRVTIRPVFWRAGSRGAPSADEARRLAGETGTFEGSLWLMARGAYTVDVAVEGARGTASVHVPVASVATGRLAMGSGLAAVLVVLGFVLCAGLITIVYKSAGESLLESDTSLDPARRGRARFAAAVAAPVLGLALLGGARWWGAVDRDYERTMYRPSPLRLSVQDNVLRVEPTDTLWLSSRRIAALVPDHGKLMHLFLVRADDGGAFAHLHPRALDTTAVSAFTTQLPPLPAGAYHVYGDVVHETGFERTLVGALSVSDFSGRRNTQPSGSALADPDDAWFSGDASRDKAMKLADGSTMSVDIGTDPIVAGREQTIRVSVLDPAGKPARLEPYLGMSAHAVVIRIDGAVYVHLHPMGTVTAAAQEAFFARDRGDTSATGQLQLSDHSAHAVSASAPATSSAIEFPYAFPKSGSYRLFVQVKRNGRVVTGAFSISVAEAQSTAR